MDFNLLFSMLGSLSFSFTLEFLVNQNQSQDFFLFEGLNSSAHFFREDTVFYLHLVNSENFTIYRSNSTTDIVSFSWNNFILNEQKMQLIRSQGEVSELHFDAFTFVSPIVDFSVTEYKNELVPLYQLKNINYGYIAAMIIIAIVLIEIKSVGIKLFDQFKVRTIEETMNAIGQESMSDVRFQHIITTDV